MTGIKNYLLLILLLFAGDQVTAQTNEFVSYTGGFKVRISEPRPRGYDGSGSGIRFPWTIDRVEIEIGFHEREGLPLAVLNGQFSYDEAVRRYYNKFSQFGERVYEGESVLMGRPGKDYRYKLKDSLYVLRLFLVDDRLYQMQAKFPVDDKQSEAKVLEIFDSVRLLDKDTVEKHFAKQIDESTPQAIPRPPRAFKQTTDLQDRNLRGRVSRVLTEIAHYALKDSLKQRKKTLLEEFDETGNLVKQIEYDSHGAPWMVRVFGYVAGKRVARVGSIPREYHLAGISVDFKGSRKADNRFDESTLYRYAAGKLVEERNLWSNGMLFGRATYRYSGRTRETQYFDGGTRSFAKKVAVLDDRGNEVKFTYFEREGVRLIETALYDLAYEAFDANDNWTRRRTMRWYGLGNVGKMFPENVEYRTIDYY